MAQFNFAEKSEIEELHIEPTDVMTGDKNKSRYLLYQLKLSMARAKQIDIIVSFLMESGVRMLLSDLKAALQRGVRIRILTGNYLGITQPSALYLLKKELGDKVELRFYSDKGRSFHPKDYMDELNLYKDVLYKNSCNNFKIIRWKKIPYVVPIATQTLVALPKDTEGIEINNIYDMRPEVRMQNIHIGVFPMNDYSIVYAFYHRRDDQLGGQG